MCIYEIIYNFAVLYMSTSLLHSFKFLYFIYIIHHFRSRDDENITSFQNSMIQINNLTFKYSRSSRFALHQIEAEIPSGIHLLVGENGAGKTTLLYAISGLLSPQTGNITIDGKSTTAMTPSVKSGIFMLDENLKITATTIRKFADIHSRFYPKFSRDILESNLAAFGLTGDELIRKQSLGDRKKSLLSYVLALGVKVLLLDEPTNGLDIQSKDTLRRIIASTTTEEQTIIISTHNVGEFRNLYDGFIAIHKGKLQLAATASRIANVLEFSVVPKKNPTSLYTELCIGGYATISKASEGRCSDIDWELLYKALMSPSGSEITLLFSK